MALLEKFEKFVMDHLAGGTQPFPDEVKTAVDDLRKEFEANETATKAIEAALTDRVTALEGGSPADMTILKDRITTLETENQTLVGRLDTIETALAKLDDLADTATTTAAPAIATTTAAPTTIVADTPVLPVSDAPVIPTADATVVVPPVDPAPASPDVAAPAIITS